MTDRNETDEGFADPNRSGDGRAPARRGDGGAPAAKAGGSKAGGSEAGGSKAGGAHTSAGAETGPDAGRNQPAASKRAARATSRKAAAAQEATEKRKPIPTQTGAAGAVSADAGPDRPARRGAKAASSRPSDSAEQNEALTGVQMNKTQRRRPKAEAAGAGGERISGGGASGIEARERVNGASLAERLRKLGVRLTESWRPRSGGVEADPATFATLSDRGARRRGGGGVGALSPWRLAPTPTKRPSAAPDASETAAGGGAPHRSAGLKSAVRRAAPDSPAAPPPTASKSASKSASRPSRAAAKTASGTPARRRRRRAGPIEGPVSRFAEVEGVQIHAAEIRGADAPTPEASAAGGDELAVLLVHGAGLDHRDWTFSFAQRLAERLGRRAWVFAIDRPGFGQSERPKGPAIALPSAQARLLRQAAEAWGVRRAVIAGHSWGGAVAAAWALAAPAKNADEGAQMSVAGLASFAGALLPWSLTEAIRHGRRIRDAARIAMRAGGFGADGLGEAARQAIAESFSPNPVPDGYHAHVATRLSAIDGPTASTMADISSINGALALSAPKLAELQTPVELVYGVQDTILSIEEQGERARALLPVARLTRLDDVGHMVHHSAPEICLAALDRLIAAAE